MTPQTMERKLLPCAHCGAKARIRPAAKALFWRVACESCGCEFADAYSSKEQAAARWNTRTPAASGVVVPRDVAQRALAAIRCCGSLSDTTPSGARVADEDARIFERALQSKP